MSFINEIILKIKNIFKKDKKEALTEGKVEDNSTIKEEAINFEKNIAETQDPKSLFSAFKISDEVLNLALEFEKKKEEVKNKEDKLASLNFEIDSLQNKKI